MPWIAFDHGNRFSCIFRKKLLKKYLMTSLLTALLFSSFVVSAQTLSVNETATAPEKIFHDVTRQTGYNFVYTENFFKKAKPITIHVTNVTLSQLLDRCFANQPFSYTIMESDKLIVIRDKIPAPREQENKNTPVTGTVSNTQNRPLAGVSIAVKKGETIAVSDENGHFALKAISNKTILVFSAVGYKTTEISLNQNSSIHIRLEEQMAELDDVVIVGYGTRHKTELTTAVGSIKMKDFVKGAAGDAAQLIRGKIPGLAIITPDGNPTAAAQIRLRGVNSIANSAAALILIDGVPGSLTTVSPGDIEQIDVLKDGSAAAIYGTRGTGGVILITTRKVMGETPPALDIHTYLSTQTIAKRLNFMNANQYWQLVAQNNPYVHDYGASTNWLNQVIRTPLSEVYNISLRAGTRNTSYILSMEYRKIEGIIRNSNNNVIFPRLELDHRMFNNKLKFNANIQGYAQSFFTTADGASYRSDLYRNALTYNPTDPIKDAYGKWTQHTDKTDYVNPVSLLEEAKGKNNNSSLRTIGSITALPVENITLKILGARDLYNSTRGYYETKQHISTIRDGKNGFASRGTTRTTDDLLELTAEYTNNWNNHQLSALAGYSWRSYFSEDYWMQNWDFPTDFYSYNNMREGTALARGLARENSNTVESKLIGAFGRINYTYKKNYHLSASIRREGSTRFGANNKMGNFPAVSAAWSLKNEPFLENAKAISTLKIRAGFGITGTEPEISYRSLDVINFATYVFVNGQWVPAASQASNPNPNLRWEKKQELNIGVDFGFWQNRFSGTIDVYKRTISDMILYNYPVPIAPYLSNLIVANAPAMQNKGVELLVKLVPVEGKKITWHSSANYAYNANKITSFTNDRFLTQTAPINIGQTGEPIQTFTHRLEINQPVGNFFGYKSVGIDNQGRWIILGKNGQPKPIASQQPDDKRIIGNGLPKHYLNFNNTISYKNLDLGVSMRGAFGFQILNMAQMFYGVPSALNRGNIFANAYDNIYGERPLSENQEQQYVSYFVQNGNYWKIDNLTIGYNINLRSPYIKKWRCYAAVSNLATITGYKGIDPEVSIAGTAPGIDDRNRYPAVRTFTLGTLLSF